MKVEVVILAASVLFNVVGGESPVSATLLLDADEIPAGGIHGNAKLGFCRSVAVNHMPDELAFSAVPGKLEDDRLLRVFLREFLAAVLLRNLVGFIAIDFQEREIEGLGGDIACAPGILGGKADSLLRRVGADKARPCEQLHHAFR